MVTAAGVASGGYVSGDMELAEKSMHARFESDPVRGFVDLDLDDWQSVLDDQPHRHAEVTAVVRGGDARPRLARDASLITIASIGAKHPDAGSLQYGVSKAGVGG